MAQIVGGVGTSHVPSIGAAVDNELVDTAYWKPLFDGYEAARAWIRDLAPDVVILIYNDHANAFSMRLIPTFVLGVAAEFTPADEGWGARRVPTVIGHPELAWHLVESLILDEFDLTIANELDVDHGLTVPLSILCGTPERWPFKVIPLAVNVIQYPPPTGRRCYALGQAIRRAIATFPDDLKVVVIGTGGMSHQLAGGRSGFISGSFDDAFFTRITDDPAAQADMSHLEYIRDGGNESVELVMWLVMRGALGEKVTEVHRHYHVPASNTAAGLLVLEPLT